MRAKVGSQSMHQQLMHQSGIGEQQGKMADEICIQSQPQLASAPLLPPSPPSTSPSSDPQSDPPAPPADDAPAVPAAGMAASGPPATVAGDEINLTASPAAHAPAPLPNHVSTPSVINAPSSVTTIAPVASSQQESCKLDHQIEPLATQSLVPVPISSGSVPSPSSTSACITESSATSTPTATPSLTPLTTTSGTCITDSLMPPLPSHPPSQPSSQLTTISSLTVSPVSTVPPLVSTPLVTATTTTAIAPVVTTIVTPAATTATTTSSETPVTCPVIPVPTAKRIILAPHSQLVLNAPIRASSHFTTSPVNAAGSSSSIPIPGSKSQLTSPLVPSLPNGNVSGLSGNAAASSCSATVNVVPLVTRSNIVTGNQSAIQSLPHQPPVVMQTSSSPAAAATITNNGPSAVPGVKQHQQPLLTSPAAATSGLLNHQLVLNSSSAGNKLLQSPQQQHLPPAAAQQTVLLRQIFTTPDGQKTVMAIGQPPAGTTTTVNQASGTPVVGPAAVTRVANSGSTSNNNNNNSTNNVISSAAGTVVLGKPLQTQANVQSQLPPVTGQQPQMHHPQQQQQQPQQVVVSNPQMQQQMVHIRTPTVMQLTPQQQQGLQRQLAPRPNFIVTGNGPLRLQSPVRAGQQAVHPQGTANFRPGAPTNCVLIRTEHGYQLLNIAPQPGLAPGQQQQIRFTVPVSSAGQVQQQMGQVRQLVNINTQPQIRTAMPSHPQQQQQAQQQLQQQHQQQQQAQINQPLSIQTAQANSQASAANSQSQMSPNTAKRKCKNFLSTLIRLATDQPEHVAQNVRKLIQGLIDGIIIPEDFTNQLQRELNSSPQPCLIPFLKKSLPHLKQSLMLGELTIDGVNPPPRTTLTQPQLPLQFQRPPAGIRYVTSSPLAFPSGGIVQTQQPQRPQMLPQMQVTSVQQQQSSISTPAASTTPGPRAKSKAKPRATSTPKDKDKNKISTSLREDDDINDVAAMGGVNLAEENQRMAAAANEVGTQIRSCKDETFFLTHTLANKINRIAAKFSLEEPSSDVISLISHAAQERIKTLVERLGVIAEHRLEVFKVDPKYEVAQDVRSQIKFLEELDKMEKRRHEEQEREMLLKAAKSRSKLEDPEQLKLKQKAKEMQRAEMEEARQREANETALLAIGPRKKLKLDSSPSLTSTPSATITGPSISTGNPVPGSASSSAGNSFTNFNNTSTPSNHFNSIFSTPFSSSSKGPMRRMTKRVYMKDLLFLMEQDRSTSKSSFLYKSYTK